MRDFKAYQEALGRPFPVAPGALVDELTAWQRNKTCAAAQGCYRNALGSGVTQGRVDPRMYERGTGFRGVERADGSKAVQFAYISANLTVPRNNLDLKEIIPEYEQVRDAAAAANAADAHGTGVEALGLTGRLMWIATLEALVTGLVTALPTSIGLSFVVLTVTTGNWRVAVMATMTIVGIMGSFFLSFVAQGLTLGVYESMFLSLTAGFAVDYVVHFAHAYNESAAPDRAGKMRDSLTAMGVSVMSGAISTLMASMMLFVCSFNFFSTYGGFIFFVIFWSILWAMCFFPALMMSAGPSADEGDVSWLRRCHKPRHAAVTAAT